MYQEEQLNLLLSQDFIHLNLKTAFMKSEEILGDKMKIITQLSDELNKLKLKSKKPKSDAQTMTDLGASYFNRKKDSISTQNSQKQFNKSGNSNQTKGSRVGGGGVISKPPRDVQNSSNILLSKASDLRSPSERSGPESKPFTNEKRDESQA